MLPPRKELNHLTRCIVRVFVFSLDDILKNYVTLNSDFECEELQKILRCNTSEKRNNNTYQSIGYFSRWHTTHRKI